MKEEIRQILVEAADRCECSAFIEGDPVQFPHRYTDRRDIEVSTAIRMKNTLYGSPRSVPRKPDGWTRKAKRTTVSGCQSCTLSKNWKNSTGF